MDNQSIFSHIHHYIECDISPEIPLLDALGVLGSPLAYVVSKISGHIASEVELGRELLASAIDLVVDVRDRPAAVRSWVGGLKMVPPIAVCVCSPPVPEF